MEQDVEKWIRELKDAGWKKHATQSTVWVSPWGGWYRGPFAAWKIMKENSPISDQSIAEAKSHLHAILVQAIPSDDKIIIDHVTAAYLALGGGLNDFLKDRPFKGGA